MSAPYEVHYSLTRILGGFEREREVTKCIKKLLAAGFIGLLGDGFCLSDESVYIHTCEVLKDSGVDIRFEKWKVKVQAKSFGFKGYIGGRGERERDDGVNDTNIE